MKRLILLTLLLAGLSIHAQVKFGLRGGTNLNQGNDPFVGAQAELTLPVLPLAFVPNAEYYFVKDVTSVNINADGQYTIVSVGLAKVFAGAGLSMSYVDPDKIGGIDPKAKTKSGFNIQAGAKVNFGINAFGLLRSTKISGNDMTHAIVVGISF